MLADVFENFRNKYIEIYEPDPAHFLSTPGLAWQACLKKTRINSELSTDNDMLMMVEKGIRGGIYHAIHRYAKANNKYMQNYNKNIASSYLMYFDANNLYCRQCFKNYLKMVLNGKKSYLNLMKS